jgi:hypothetical protein
MTQPLTEALVEAAREAARTDVVERDQIAWNLPRAREDESASPGGADFDWAGFSRAFYPGSGRHDLQAIAAYAAYKRSSDSV